MVISIEAMSIDGSSTHHSISPSVVLLLFACITLLSSRRSPSSSLPIHRLISILVYCTTPSWSMQQSLPSNKSIPSVLSSTLRIYPCSCWMVKWILDCSTSLICRIYSIHCSPIPSLQKKKIISIIRPYWVSMGSLIVVTL